jgi:hypothetical protein
VCERENSNKALLWLERWSKNMCERKSSNTRGLFWSERWSTNWEREREIPWGQWRLPNPWASWRHSTLMPKDTRMRYRGGISLSPEGTQPQVALRWTVETKTPSSWKLHHCYLQTNLTTSLVSLKLQEIPPKPSLFLLLLLLHPNLSLKDKVPTTPKTRNF